MIGWGALRRQHASVERGDTGMQTAVQAAGFVLAGAVVLVACTARGTDVGAFTLMWAGTIGALAMTSGSWRAWARRHRRTDFILDCLLIASFAKVSQTYVTRGATTWPALAAGAASAILLVVVRRSFLRRRGGGDETQAG